MVTFSMLFFRLLEVLMSNDTGKYWRDDGEEEEKQERTTLQSAAQDFFVFHETNNASTHTLDNYRARITPFIDWLCAECKLVYVDQVRVRHLRGYVNFLQKKTSRRGYSLSDLTVHQYALDVSIFCHWLVREGLMDKAVTENFELPKYERKETPALTYNDVEKLLEVCEEGPKDQPRVRKALTARNRAIVSVLCDSGIRRSELVGLRLGDVDRQMRLLYVKRKGRKWQQVPISYEGFKPLHEYITKHRSVLAALGAGTGSKKDDPVFLGRRGEPMTTDGVGALFKRLRNRSGITDKPIRSHQGRRYMATTQLNAGRNPLDVQRQMGHTTLLMTNRYFSQTVEGLKKSHEQHSPLRKRSGDNHTSGLGSGYYEE
jgi:site-specific recombinase XerD